MAAAHQILGQSTLRVHGGVGLGNDVFALVHGRQINHLFGDPALDDPTVGAFDEAVFIDLSIGRQAVDQADIGAFGSLDRADAAVVGGMHIAHLETRPLARQTARPKRRQAPLMRDLGQGIGLIHELAELRRAEEFAHRRRRRFGVDQVMRHDAVDFDRAHALPNRPLHAQQADMILVFQELADRTHPTIAQMVDIVDIAASVLEIDQGLDHGQNVFLAQDTNFVTGIEVEAGIELDPSHRRQIIAVRVGEQPLEQGLGGLNGRRLAGAHHAIDFEQGLVAVRAFVECQGIADIGTDGDPVDGQSRQLGDPRLNQSLDQLRGDLVTRLAKNLAGFLIDQIVGDEPAFQGIDRHKLFGNLGVDKLLDQAGRHLGAGVSEFLTILGVDQVAQKFGSPRALGIERRAPTFLVLGVDNRAVERLEDFRGGHVDGVEQGRHRQLAATIDTHIDQILGVEFEIEP